MLPRAMGARLGGVGGASHATLLMMQNQGAETAVAVMPARSATPLNSRPKMARLPANEGQDLIA